ncbi:very-long-chain (3R)-3-hydroxyacyl-CoA dehydratase 2 isoform X3 [Buteo buteo]|uniref:very-long-chain (3R)-3-hydroxyacyl-CoA dehydratase 2 isoform X3 n=1 Tax=Buteo buteo TaxID=30397 RepID=UPI003EC01853
MALIAWKSFCLEELGVERGDRRHQNVKAIVVQRVCEGNGEKQEGFGIVPSSVVLTAFQVMSRVFLTWAVTHSVKEVQTEDSVLLFVVAWTITEIIRYSFYTFSLLNHLPYLIKWARYTLFIILYPMGVSGELLTIYAALPFVRQSGLYSISLPNKYNFSFDYYTFLILVMISYIPIFPQLYFHMLHQRRKVLSHTEEHKKSE